MRQGLVDGDDFDDLFVADEEFNGVFFKSVVCVPRAEVHNYAERFFAVDVADAGCCGIFEDVKAARVIEVVAEPALSYDDEVAAGGVFFPVFSFFIFNTMFFEFAIKFFLFGVDLSLFGDADLFAFVFGVGGILIEVDR